jgi:hypothetical protein
LFYCLLYQFPHTYMKFILFMNKLHCIHNTDQ